MEHNNLLNSIPEDISTSETDTNTNKLVVEIIYYSDFMSAIKSYYLLTNEEYENLMNLHRDIYIENFINNERLDRDKLDIHIIQNTNSIKLCKEFLSIFGNTFDILSYISNFKNSDINNLNNFIIDNNKFSEELGSDSDSNKIDTITEIIDTYNKSGKIDERINNLISKDDIIDELKCFT
jgi:hypothetical protein